MLLPLESRLRHSWSGEQGLLYFAKLYALTPQLDLRKYKNAEKCRKMQKNAEIHSKLNKKKCKKIRHMRGLIRVWVLALSLLIAFVSWRLIV